MTNSERITAHNARLAAMKETVAGLPDAGGGGGAVETCTVNFRYNFPIHDMALVVYVDDNNQSQYTTIETDTTIEVVKGSYIAVGGWGTMVVLSGDIVYVENIMTTVCYKVSGDCGIMYEG